MKTPDEIKKGLECCISTKYECEKACPYNSIVRYPVCKNVVMKDCYALIEQLEARLHGLYLEQQEAATLKADYDVLFKRFRHLIQSDFIASFDQLDPKTHTYKRDIAEADVHLLHGKPVPAYVTVKTYGGATRIRAGYACPFCGTNFIGKYCAECGAKIDGEA